ncbi:hypothetical protein FSP39_018283 [Pinctada imbricata]|uniref:Triokinase/FMN cyclase n=1 Tax=Pinctada imbricata TaxID=66713 RepID=A0AA89BZM1_PINIB|nr:hypothetical protein FSP39_018283 [Pinctada imbricata]
MSSASKKLINSVERCVDEALEGLVAVNPAVRLLEGHRVVVRGDIRDVVNSSKVTLLSGGGSGHEPAHPGYIGRGMLSASVAGAVFTSPPPGDILAALRTISTPDSAGTIIIVTNYTGDRLNFGLAMERGLQEGLKIEMVIVGDDCALTSNDKTAGRRGLVGTMLIDKVAGTLIIVKNYTGDRLNFGLAAERAKAEGLKVNMVVVGEDSALTSSDKTAGRRGLCGTVFMHKICGALAEEGRSLEDITKIARDAATKMGTIGVSLTPCSVPGAGPSFQLGADEMELGLGMTSQQVHIIFLQLLSAKEVVTMMLDHMTNTQSSTHLPVKKGDKVACMVNNLGGTSVLEMSIIAREAISQLESRGVVVERAYCASFMTSLEMAGVSITLLHLDDTLRKCLDADTTAPGWSKPWLPQGETTRVTPTPMVYQQKADTAEISTQGANVSKEEAAVIYKIIKLIAERLIAAEEKLNSLDKESGDGDCGSTLARGSLKIQSKLGSLESPGLPVGNPSQLALTLAGIVEDSMGGSSGGLYSLFCTAASVPLQKGSSGTQWCEALKAGISTIMRYGGAEPGDRTMLDALHAAGTVFTEAVGKKSAMEAFTDAVQAADKAAQSTATMKARAGRASYVSADHLKNPDPGAVAVTIWMKAILDCTETMNSFVILLH